MNPPYTYPQSPPQFVAKTAINELDSFMSGLTDEDRMLLFSSPEFAQSYGDLLNKFMFYLLQGPLGTDYINSSTGRRESAEHLKLVAHNIYAANKKHTVSRIEQLEEENKKLQDLLKGQSNDAK